MWGDPGSIAPGTGGSLEHPSPFPSQKGAGWQRLCRPYQLPTDKRRQKSSHKPQHNLLLPQAHADPRTLFHPQEKCSHLPLCSTLASLCSPSCKAQCARIACLPECTCLQDPVPFSFCVWFRLMASRSGIPLSPSQDSSVPFPWRVLLDIRLCILESWVDGGPFPCHAWPLVYT